jgi:hypothetical protein
MWHKWDRREVMQNVCRKTLKERDYLKDEGVDGEIILKWLFKQYNGNY